MLWMPYLKGRKNVQIIFAVQPNKLPLQSNYTNEAYFNVLIILGNTIVSRRLDKFNRGLPISKKGKPFVNPDQHIYAPIFEPHWHDLYVQLHPFT